MNYYFYQPIQIYEFRRQDFSSIMNKNLVNFYVNQLSILSLNDLAQIFWLWDDQWWTTNTKNQNEQIINTTMSSYQKTSSDYSKYCWWDKVLYEFAPNKHNSSIRHRKNFLPNINRNLQRILMLSYNGKEVAFKHSIKSARGLFYGVSRRRSQYIGVLKNRGKWQVLINEGRIKKYIGTYLSEAEAAVVHDFYSIGINGLSAKTNFSYNHSQVMKMIEIYFSNNQTFDPSIYLQMN